MMDDAIGKDGLAALQHVQDWRNLLDEACDGSMLRASPWHGEMHWRAVGAVGLEIARRRPLVDAGVVLAFAMIHDARRENEDYDPEHGLRAMRLAVSSKTLRLILPADRISHLADACLMHEKGEVDRRNPTIGACWDADRYNLLRLEIDPLPRLLSSGFSDSEHEEVCAYANVAWQSPPGWQDMVGALLSGNYRHAPLIALPAALSLEI